MAGTDVLMQKKPVHQWAPGVWTLGGQGSSLALSTGAALVLVDAGPGGEVTQRMIDSLRSVTALPLSHIVYSHGHMGYNNGVQMWLDEAARRGVPPPKIVGHARLPHRYRRYRETGGLQSYTNTRQFRSPYPADPPAHWFRPPDITYEDEHLIVGTERKVLLMHAPSETDDATALWQPDLRLLYGSCAMIKSLPNAGSPYRILRDPVVWAQTLERFLALRPAILVPEFGRPLTDPDDIHDALHTTAQALRWVRAQVVERMNRGMDEQAILHDIAWPQSWAEHRYLKPGYGCVDYLVREVWRSENGWWDRNGTQLHPSPPQQAADARHRALPDPMRVLRQARSLAQAGQWQRALHVVDLLALASPGLAGVDEARQLKAELLDKRAGQMTSAVSRQVMRSSAELLRGQPIGATDLARGDQAFQWE